MSQTTLAYLGIAAGLTNVIGIIPYIRSIKRHHTRPERASWWIWTGLMVLSFGAQAAAGATWSLFLTGSFLLCNIYVSVLSLKYGYGRFRLYDMLAIIIALAGAVIWLKTSRPLLALIAIVIADFTGVILVAGKSWRAPYSENLLSWCLVGVAAFLGILSVGEVSAAKIIFPAYVFLSNFLVAALIEDRRRWRSRRIKDGLKA